MKFRSEPIEEHAEVPLADDGRLQSLVDRWTQRERRQEERRVDGQACYVVSVQRGPLSEGQVEEITSLVRTQGDRVVGAQVHILQKPDPRTLIRKGVAERIARAAGDCGADMLVLDAELTPSQARNLEDVTGLPVCDREAVILNVFERHATTRRARVQVEIAHLEYLRPRIRGIGLSMDQQTGGIVGDRGPGETASELLARRLDGRLAELRRRLVELERSDSTQRRSRRGCARVVLVGYTNAGKTSLMNALTEAGLSARDRPFETLDTTSRALSRHGGDVLLSDTVGFIRRLPERLFASFESTLAEVAEASLLLVVLDASSPEIDEHRRTTQDVLERLGAERVPRLVVLNKIDRLPGPLDASTRQVLADAGPHVALSSHDSLAIADLRRTILDLARGHHRVRQVFVPYELPHILAMIYARCRVLESVAAPSGTQLRIEGEPHVVQGIVRAIRSCRP